MKKNGHMIVARTATEVFSPFVLLGGLLIVVACTTDPHPWLAAAVPLVFIVGIPQALSIWMAHRGDVTDRFIVRREQRHRFYAASLASILGGVTAVQLLPIGLAVRLSVWVCLGVLVLVSVINLRVKISVHALTAVFVAIAAAGLLGGAWLGVFAPVTAVVCWSRVALRKHTGFEVGLGALGGLVTAAAYLSLLP